MINGKGRVRGTEQEDCDDRAVSACAVAVNIVVLLCICRAAAHPPVAEKHVAAEKTRRLVPPVGRPPPFV